MPKPDLCMFCNCSPCECNTRKKPKPRPRVVKPEPPAETPEPTQQARPSALESMRAASKRLPPKAPAPPRPTYHQQSDEDKELVQAVQVVTTLLGATFVDEADAQRLRVELNRGPDPRIRAALWRSRRREASDGER